MKRRSIIRIALPVLLLATSALCTYNAAYFAWAHTAQPDTHNDYYKLMFNIYGTLALILPIAAVLIFYLLRSKTKVEPDGTGQPM